jgi:cytochrome c peroxidase
MKKILLFVVLACLSILCSQSCAKDEALYQYEVQGPNLPAVTFRYKLIDLAPHLDQDEVWFQNFVNDDKATLGRVLFYDKRLSRTNTISCASCHVQANGFADNRSFSTGFDGRPTLRNASSISNVLWQHRFFWDGRENNLRELVLQPIKNHIEMGMGDLDVLEAKLAELPYYPPLFQKAFLTQEITRDRIAEALQQFLGAMVSGNSRFDLALQEKSTWNTPPQLFESSQFSDSERKGMNVFFNKGRCFNCHQIEDIRQGYNFFDIGLDETYTDIGIGIIFPGSEGMFMVPSLRNVAQSAPYMHDGRFATLEAVVDHYSDHVKNSPKLNGIFRNDTDAPGVHLKPEEKRQLVDFLKTLTDENYLKAEQFSDPFKY